MKHTREQLQVRLDHLHNGDLCAPEKPLTWVPEEYPTNNFFATTFFFCRRTIADRAPITIRNEGRSVMWLIPCQHSPTSVWIVAFDPHSARVPHQRPAANTR